METSDIDLNMRDNAVKFGHWLYDEITIRPDSLRINSMEELYYMYLNER